MFTLSMAVELALLFILCFGVYSGARKGFLGLSARPVKLIASAIAAYSACDVVARRLVAPAVRTPISSILSRYLGDAASDALGERITHAAALAISFALIYFLSRAVISVVISFSDTVFSVGPLGCVNRTAGAILGFLVALILAWVFTASVNIALETGSLGEFTDSSEAPHGVLYRALRADGSIGVWRKIQLINLR